MRAVIYRYFAKSAVFTAMRDNTPQADGGTARGNVA